jgi:hypothetical protein
MIELDEHIESELQRRILVEEAWARRRVLARQMNLRRRLSYLEKRAIVCPQEPAVDWVGKYPPLDEKFDWPEG